MTWKSKLLKNFKLYAVTDLKEKDPSFLKKAEAALSGGVDVLQLRSKVLKDGDFLRIGRALRVLTRKMKKLFIVNDRLDLAEILDADGVHLGQEDIPVAQARKILRIRSKFIGKSTHSLEQALEAEKEGVDYIGVGPVFSTPTKPLYEPVGIDLVSRVADSVRIPFVAIGGIDAENMEQVLEAGARRVAVVRAIWGNSNTFKAAQKLKEILNHHEMPILQVSRHQSH